MLRHLALMLGTALVLGLQLALPMDMTGRHTDLASFHAAGRAAAVGTNPYAITPELWVVELPAFGIRASTVNLNMPVSVLWMEASAPVDLTTLFRVSLLLNIILYGIALALLARSSATLPWRVAWAVCLAGFWQTLALGQIYLWMLPLVIGAWLAVRDQRFVRAGWLLGVLISVKPQFALWPVWLACIGIWQTLPIALASAAMISALPLLRYGPIIYYQWFASLAAVDALIRIPGNGSLVALFARLGRAEMGTLLAVGLLAALTWWCWRRRPDRLTVSALALIAMLLAGPVSWTGYTLFLLPALWERPWSPRLGLGALLLATPFPMIWNLSMQNSLTFVGVGAWWTWVLLLLGWAFWREPAALRCDTSPSRSGGPAQVVG
ncbi:glycosyltransferase family 87 protein [Kallotenue papyrolyticum]|uniref:glycosyltransferase family 87 protein n=1 Tax=Kallotenue papyrolyticum TaxID=1325125 RepID=UPI000472A224|nr:glycosyltransferase family 87 protein [Kallotenue papyrolyticum]